MIVNYSLRTKFSFAGDFYFMLQSEEIRGTWLIKCSQMLIGAFFSQRRDVKASRTLIFISKTYKAEAKRLFSNTENQMHHFMTIQK